MDLITKVKPQSIELAISEGKPVTEEVSASAGPGLVSVQTAITAAKSVWWSGVNDLSPTNR